MTPRPASARGGGFTLLEVLVVVVVVAIVASIALIALVNAVDRTRQRATMEDMQRLSAAIESYRTAHGQPPQSVQQLGSTQDPVLPAHDRWGNEYGYRCDTDGNYVLESFGKDGKDGVDISLAHRFYYERDIVLANGRFTAAPE